MRRQIVPAIRMLIVATIVLGLAYPLALTGVAQALFPDQAEGSLITRDGEVVGSDLVGQSFSAPGYFHSRPSAAAYLSGTPSGASNQGPTNPDLLAAIEERADAYREANHLSDQVEIPIDAVTASASGVDPHISVANARLQAPRVAEERGLELSVVLDLVDEHTSGRSLGFLGEPGVNVLELNLGVDEAAQEL